MAEIQTSPRFPYRKSSSSGSAFVQGHEIVWVHRLRQIAAG